MSDHSLLTRAYDGFWAPRWVHHLVKLLTGVLVLWASIHLSTPTAGALFSLVWFLSLRIAYWLDHRGPFWKPDLVCDTALHCAAIVAVLPYPVSVLLGVFVVLAYCVTYPDAAP